MLLKNDGVLPLKPGQKVLLVGNDATSPFVHGGGSGSVEPTYTVSPLRAITTRNGGTVPKSGGGGGAPLNCTVLDQDTDYFSSPGAMDSPFFLAVAKGHGAVPLVQFPQ